MKMISQCNKILRLLVFFLILGVVFLICMVNFQAIEYSKLNDSAFHIGFERWYNQIIEPEGNAAIDEIVDKASAGVDSREKFGIIAAEIVTGFENCWWNPNACWLNETDDQYDWKAVDSSHWNYTNKLGDIRVGYGPLNHNPAVIAYFKTGACGELADLFAEVARRSGYETRRVTSQPGYDHAWDEVLVDGEWKYVDLTLYWAEKDGRVTGPSLWFNSTDVFRCYNKKVTMVHDVITNENLTVNYPPCVA